MNLVEKTFNVHKLSRYEREVCENLGTTGERTCGRFSGHGMRDAVIKNIF